ncbi:hypothetical protein INR77_11675 [Erythrobacter sp. SCSIO 43205]|uniref:hypothetical protein n=1 Tax=Erythrobacter sp. SCSIO 43205 TaxID=2779361 RepID=UPI001CA9A85F|nr:hypothetical protein [Erythrobacter sp. SCSIO 43205]UAB77454.1 hypothetical protein INR77_11675 [Erythrobacter sp. SCSIO 43205]
MAHQNRFAGKKAAWASLLAASSLALTPAQAQAAEMAPVATAGYATGFIAQATASTTGATALDALGPRTPGADTVQEYGRYGWRGGWRGYRRHRRGVSAGDVIAGVAILGGIAAIASAANNNRKREREVVVVERERDYRYRPENRRSTVRSTTSGSGIDNAVSMCLNEIEQDIRVDSVDGASRVGSGWIVTGSLFDGSGFSCQIDNSGRISGIDYGRSVGVSSLGSTQSFARAEGQLSDNRYASARANVGGTTRPDLAIDPTDMGGTNGSNIAINPDDERLPAYPGGPLPGEEFRD